MVAGTRSIRELALGAAWLVGTAAALRLLEVAITQNALTVAILGALLVDVAATRAGVTWGSPADGALGVPAGRAGLGAAFAVGAAAVTLALGAAFGLCDVALGAPAVPFLLALLRAGGVAVRDELLLRGVVLRAAGEAGIPAPFATAFAALASGAMVAFAPGSSAAATALALASGWLFAELWRRAGGAWAAVGAHAAWSMLVASGLRGSLLEVVWTNGALIEGPKASGAPAWLGALACAAAAAVVALRLRAPAEGSRAQAASD